MASRKSAPPEKPCAAPLRFKSWLEQLTWTEAHAEAYRQIERRSLPEPSRALEESYPPSERVDGWLEAAFVDNALACAGRRERLLTPAFANTIAFQVSGRSWGWTNYLRQGEELRDRDRVRFFGAILCALTGEWDKATAILGSRPLARKVTASKTYGEASFGGLVRHLATAAKRHLGEGSCQAALTAWAENPRSTPGPLLALACLAIEGAGGHPRAEVADRLEALLTSTAAAPVKVARPLVEDARASVFERYLPVLGDLQAVTRAREGFSEDYVNTGWLVEAWVLGLDALVERALAKPEGSSSVLPNASRVASASLGRAVPHWRERQREELKRFHAPRQLNTLARYRWSTQAAAVALAAGDTRLVLKLTVGPKKEPFKPGKTFGEDARRALRYFARALDAGACQADVTPAWLELLVARIPDNYDDTLTGGAWGWPSLLCVAYVYFHQLGGAPEEDVGRLLRDTLRGVR